MALFNPFRENVPIAQKPPAVQLTASPKCAPPPSPSLQQQNNVDGNSRGRGSARFGRGGARGVQPARGRAGGRGGRGARSGGSWRRNIGTTPETEEPPVDFQCEACERVFFSDKDLDEHLSLHVSCPHCRYAALQQLVDLHIKLVHDKHIASKVMEQSPEEIAEYLAERRRRFPRRKVDSNEPLNESAATVPETKGVIHENNVRGNRRGKFGHTIVKDSRQTNDEAGGHRQGQRTRKRKRRRVRSSRGERIDDEHQVLPVRDDGPQIVEGVPRFKGVVRANLLRVAKSGVDGVDEEMAIHAQDNISDVDDFTPAAPQLPLAAASKALASLMACYSDSDEEDTAAEPPVTKARYEDDNAKSNSPKVTDSGEAPSSDNLKNHNASRQAPVSRVQLDEAARHNAVTEIVKAVPDFEASVRTFVCHEVKAAVRSLVDRVVAAEDRLRRPVRRPLQPVAVQISQRKLSLLEKLLSRDIRHERNILLQCVDFVVQKNFFDGMNFDV